MSKMYAMLTDEKYRHVRWVEIISYDSEDGTVWVQNQNGLKRNRGQSYEWPVGQLTKMYTD